MSVSAAAGIAIEGIGGTGRSAFGHANNPAQFALFSTEAQALGMQAVQLDVRTPPDMEPAFASLTVPTALLVRADMVIE